MCDRTARHEHYLGVGSYQSGEMVGTARRSFDGFSGGKKLVAVAVRRNWLRTALTPRFSWNWWWAPDSLTLAPV